MALIEREKQKSTPEKPKSTSLGALNAENSPTSPLVEVLNRSLANGFVLYMNYKHYHWQTYGPLFRDLHLMFDEFSEAVLNSLDELAERVRMIGQDPPGHLAELQDLASVTPAASKATMREHIERADKNALIVIKELRDAAKLADEHDDPGSVDLFSKLVQVHEKHEWWLRDILRGNDGLTD
jgi:starvation-inducible DNA-binding protein